MTPDVFTYGEKWGGFSSHPHAKSPMETRLLAASKMRGVPPQMLELVAGLGEVWSAQTLAAYLKTTGIPGANNNFCQSMWSNFIATSNRTDSPPNGGE